MKSLADQVLEDTKVEEGFKHIYDDKVTKGKEFTAVFYPESENDEVGDIKLKTDISGLLDYWLGAHMAKRRPTILMITHNDSEAQKLAEKTLKEYKK